jgi:cytoskeletal protein RodZ
MNEAAASFADLLRQAREANSLTLREVADHL